MTRDEATRVSDPVNRPAHYVGDGMEAIDVIEDWQLGFHLGNATKYILRAGRKGDRRQDLEKALWYVRRARDRRPDGVRGRIMSRHITDAFRLRWVEEEALSAILSAVQMPQMWREYLSWAAAYLGQAIAAAAHDRPEGPSAQEGAAASRGHQHDGDPTPEQAAATRVRRQS